MARLVACPGCDRHVRASESHCPFCAYGPLRCTAPTPARWVLGVSLATFVAAPLVACDKGATRDAESSKEPASADEGKADGSDESPADGDANSDDAVAPDDDSDRKKPIYGAPRQTTAGDPEDDVASPDDDGEVVPQKTIYGGPRQMTAGPPDDDATPDDEPEPEKPRPAPKYGAPPKPPAPEKAPKDPFQ